VPWARRLGATFVPGLVPTGGSLVSDDPSGERFPRVADALSGVWSRRVGKPVGGMPGVLLLWTDGQGQVPRGIRLWRQGGPSQGEVASGLRSQARRRGWPPAYVLFESWDAAAQMLNLLAGWGGQ
jgi:hypothetical protein